MDKKKEYLRKDLEKELEKGDVVQVKGNRRIYHIKYSPENLMKYSPDYFKKRGHQRAKVSLLIKRKNQKTGGAMLENIFNKREDENMRITIPYKYFHDTMEYFNLVKGKTNPEGKKNSFFSSVDQTKMTLQTSEGKKDLNKEEKGFLFNWGSKGDEEPVKKVEEGEPVKKVEGEETEPAKTVEEGEPLEETRDREIKVVVEGELLEYTREYYEDKRRERNNPTKGEVSTPFSLM